VGSGEAPKKKVENNNDVANRCATNVNNMTNVGELFNFL